MFACFCGGRPQTAEEPALAKAKAAAASKEGWQSGEPHEPLIGTALTPEEGPAAEASQPAIDEPDSPGSGQEGQAAAEGAAASGDGGAADGGVATDVAAQPSKVEEIEGQGSAGADEAADDEAAAAGEVPDRSAAAEEAAAEGAPPVAAEGSAGAAAPPAAEGSESSQAALLSPHEEDASVLSLKAPRLSRLSALFSCSSSGAVLDGGELRSQQQSMQGGGGSARVTHASTPTPIDLQFEAAAAELALLPRSKLLALAQPEQALADAAGMLGREEAPVLLTALLTLRRVAIHHHALLAGSLQDVSALMAECIGGSSAQVSQAAIMCLLDLFISLGAPMLRHCENQLVPHQSCLLALLLAASLGRTPEIRHWAEQALSWMARRMPQARVISLLEPYLEHALPQVRQKAAQHLVTATYRPPDRPVSPSASPSRWQG